MEKYENTFSLKKPGRIIGQVSDKQGRKGRIKEIHFQTISFTFFVLSTKQKISKSFRQTKANLKRKNIPVAICTKAHKNIINAHLSNIFCIKLKWTWTNKSNYKWKKRNQKSGPVCHNPYWAKVINCCQFNLCFSQTSISRDRTISQKCHSKLISFLVGSILNRHSSHEPHVYHTPWYIKYFIRFKFNPERKMIVKNMSRTPNQECYTQEKFCYLVSCE